MKEFTTGEKGGHAFLFPHGQEIRTRALTAMEGQETVSSFIGAFGEQRAGRGRV